jgi:hypothetical protein
MGYPLSRQAVEAAAKAMWDSEHPEDPAADEESGYRFMAEGYRHDAVIALRAALAAWEPSAEQFRAADNALVDPDKDVCDALLAAVRTETE